MATLESDHPGQACRCPQSWPWIASQWVEKDVVQDPKSDVLFPGISFRVSGWFVSSMCCTHQKSTREQKYKYSADVPGLEHLVIVVQFSLMLANIQSHNEAV